MPALIVPARWPHDAPAIRDLCREYAASLPYSLCFQGFDAELAGLPGKYALPSGRFLIAIDDAAIGASPRLIGCVAMRALGWPEAMPDDPWPICEMKRLYIRPSHRGTGLGRRLAQAIVHEARTAGYAMMKLDSDTSCMQAANALYRSLGFIDIPPYNGDPTPYTVWLGLVL